MLVVAVISVDANVILFFWLSQQRPDLSSTSGYWNREVYH